MSLDRECRCPAYPWPHEFGLSDCGDRLAREAVDNCVGSSAGRFDTANCHLDDPRTGQAAGLNSLIRRPE